MERNPMQKLNDLSRSLAPLKPDGTLIAVIEMSLSSWLVAGIVPGIERPPLRKLDVALFRSVMRGARPISGGGERLPRSHQAETGSSRCVQQPRKDVGQTWPDRGAQCSPVRRPKSR